MTEQPENIEIEKAVPMGVPGGASALRPKERLGTPLSDAEKTRYQALVGEPRALPAIPEGHPPTGLILDTDPKFRQLAITRMQPLKLALYECGDGAAALKFLLENPVHLLVLNLKLPSVDGFRLIRILRSYLSSPTLAICVLTSLDDPKDEATALELGADEFLLKPLVQDRLMARLRCLFRLKFGAR